jgi:hypothetical protein
MKIQKLLDMDIKDFNEKVKNKEIRLRAARLIPPVMKAGDEVCQTSIFLSVLRMVKEFRDDLFSDIGLKRSGRHSFYTEVSFYDNSEERPDGLILNTSSNEIKDAILIEVKNKNNVIDDTQIARYVELAKTIGITKILTISNQFVSDPTHSPVHIKLPKGITLYHFSWTYILTRAHVLLFENDHNISDTDQVAIMKEFVLYLEHKDSGLHFFETMKGGWKDCVKQFSTGVKPTKSDPEIVNAIESWMQEEQDLALKLSRKLGLLVGSKVKNNSNALFDQNFKTLSSSEKYLSSIIKIPVIVSPIEIIAYLGRKTLSMSVELSVPKKTVRGQIGWLKKQLDSCRNKGTEKFSRIEEDLMIKAQLKYRNEYPMFHIRDFERSIDELKDKEITGFKVLYINHLGNKFDGAKMFVTELEDMLILFYSTIVQHLKNPPKENPKIAEKTVEEEPQLRDA